MSEDRVTMIELVAHTHHGNKIENTKFVSTGEESEVVSMLDRAGEELVVDLNERGLL
jgi:hypothetical protein